ncbi:MAG: carboxymuconolactone decarboxylase family protein [Thermodesulfobacteriota bacterium]
MAPRIDLPENKDLPPEIADLLALLPPLHAFRMMAAVPSSFRPFLDLAGSVLSGAAFDPRLREIAVLRVTRQMKCNYAWTHHVTVGKATGLTDTQIAAIESEDPVCSLDEEGNLLCRAADEITVSARLADDTLEKIKARYGNSGAAALILCCAYFNMLGRCLLSMRVELEKEKVL